MTHETGPHCHCCDLETEEEEERTEIEDRDRKLIRDTGSFSVFRFVSADDDHVMCWELRPPPV